jgi:hypothetical protein
MKSQSLKRNVIFHLVFIKLTMSLLFIIRNCLLRNEGLKYLELRDLSNQVSDISVYLAFQFIPKLEKIGFHGSHHVSIKYIKSFVCSRTLLLTTSIDVTMNKIILDNRMGQCSLPEKI